ncbi:hypothetical protein JW868_03580 [Candidatus Woesearchaeota archaeon]|nr:hypothetical protein [Candidatus Woesearchaeota archaeon]
MPTVVGTGVLQNPNRGVWVLALANLQVVMCQTPVWEGRENTLAEPEEPNTRRTPLRSTTTNVRRA